MAWQLFFWSAHLIVCIFFYKPCDTCTFQCQVSFSTFLQGFGQKLGQNTLILLHCGPTGRLLLCTKFRPHSFCLVLCCISVSLEVSFFINDSITQSEDKNGKDETQINNTSYFHCCAKWSHHLDTVGTQIQKIEFLSKCTICNVQNTLIVIPPVAVS